MVRKLAVAGPCLLLALAVSATFTVEATLTGKHRPLDIYLGAVWTYTLSLIISSPILVPYIRKRLA